MLIIDLSLLYISISSTAVDTQGTSFVNLALKFTAFTSVFGNLGSRFERLLCSLPSVALCSDAYDYFFGVAKSKFLAAGTFLGTIISAKSSFIYYPCSLYLVYLYNNLSFWRFKAIFDLLFYFSGFLLFYIYLYFLYGD